MAQEDEEDEAPLSDIPSFEDLVDEVRKREAESTAAERPESASQRKSSEDSATSENTDIDSTDPGWVWGDSDSEMSSGGGKVDNLWGESDSASESEPGDALDASKSEALLELTGDSSVLMVGPREVPVEHEICSQLSDVEIGGKRKRLLISTNQTADERLESLDPFEMDSFDETIIIVVGDRNRSNGRREPVTQNLGEEKIILETLHNPQDLTRMGVLINKYLSDGDSPPVLCFHSLNDILQFVGVEKVFRFLHILRSRVQSVGSHGHYQLDPTSVDEATISTLKPLFEFTVRYDETGSITVEPRA